MFSSLRARKVCQELLTTSITESLPKVFDKWSFTQCDAVRLLNNVQNNISDSSIHRKQEA